MRYSIQNSGGEVYALRAVPQPIVVSAEQLRTGLEVELAADLGINGVAITRDIAGDTEVERIVVDIVTDAREEGARIARVHAAVTALATQTA